MKPISKVLIVVVLAAAVGGLLVLKHARQQKPALPAAEQEAARPSAAAPAAPSPEAPSPEAPGGLQPGLPRLVDLGAGKCIPCKMMAPILEDLKKEYAGTFDVQFIDVWENPDAGKQYGIKLIPTQIFYDAAGKELFRHEGFFGKEDILGKWKEFGVQAGSSQPPGIVREEPVAADTRPRDTVCFICDEDVDPRTKTLVKGAADQRILCSPHCYFIYLSSIVNADVTAETAKASVTDWATGALIPAASAQYLYGMDTDGRPTIKAFAGKDDAAKEQQTGAGNLLTWDVLAAKELAARCAFCDRAVYPEDACSVVFGSTHGYGCCTHCSMGVAARLKQDIEVVAKDGLTGEPIRVKTLDGQIASLDPPTAVAWFGQKKAADGTWMSAGCFKQGFFASSENLEEWLDARPAATGRQISIAQALADKMKLSPEQIAKACKLGECK